MPRPLLAALLLLVSTAALHGQGALTPPGAPAPTMKTLSQVEPRRPIDAANTPGDNQSEFIISQPGSYYLTANIVAGAGKLGIAVLPTPGNRGVSIDLNGFSIVGPGAGAGGNLAGIFSVDAAGLVQVRNGSVSDWPGQGVSLAGVGQVSDLIVTRTGGRGININGGSSARSSLVERCQIREAVGQGIFALGGTVRDCQVIGVAGGSTGAVGITAKLVSNCSVDGVVNGVASSGFLNVGITAEMVTECAVGNVSGVSATRGISADHVAGCQINRTDVTVAGSETNYGIDARLIERCNILAYTANTTGEVGAIRGFSVSHCVIQRVSNAGSGQVAAIQEASVASTGSGTSTTLALHAVGNTISGVNGVGIRAPFGVAHIEGNFIRGCTGISIRTDTSGAILGNTVTIPSGSSSAGISAASCRVADNTVTNFGSGTGIVQTLGIAVRNTVQSGTAFSFAAGVRAGPIVTGGGSTAFDANANVDL